MMMETNKNEWRSSRISRFVRCGIHFTFIKKHVILYQFTHSACIISVNKECYCSTIIKNHSTSFPLYVSIKNHFTVRNY